MSTIVAYGDERVNPLDHRMIFVGQIDHFHFQVNIPEIRYKSMMDVENQVCVLVFLVALIDLHLMH